MVGYTVPLVEARIAGLAILILALVMAAMKCVVYYSSPEQRAASLPYSGFNSTWVTPSWRRVKVFSVSGLQESAGARCSPARERVRRRTLLSPLDMEVSISEEVCIIVIITAKNIDV